MLRVLFCLLFFVFLQWHQEKEQYLLQLGFGEGIEEPSIQNSTLSKKINNSF